MVSQQYRISKLFLLLIVSLSLSACASNWSDPYKKPEPVVVKPPVVVAPPRAPEPEPAVVETMPLPDRSVVIEQPVQTPEPPPVVMQPEPEVEIPAVVALRGQAADAISAGDAELAAATIERAIRIQPQNPILWLDLAAVRFNQNEYAQSESMAKRAISYASGRSSVLYDAWSLVAMSRYARNDKEGGERADAEAALYQ